MMYDDYVDGGVLRAGVFFKEKSGSRNPDSGEEAVIAVSWFSLGLSVCLA